MGLIAFYFWASAPKLASEQYKQSKIYERSDPQSYQRGDTLRAMTYNIGYLSGMTNNLSVKRERDFFDENLARARDLVSTYEPDLIGLQEVDFGAHRSFEVNQADTIGKSNGFLQAFHSVNWDKKYVPFPFGPFSNHFGSMLSGQSIISRYPLQNSDHLVLPKPLNAPFYYRAFYLDRLIQVSDWLIGDQVVKVMNLHLEAFDKETRVLQAEIVKKEYLKYYQDYPVLILGDFNSRSAFLDRDAMQVIMEAPGISTAVDQKTYEANPSSFFTFSSASPEYMIDYILFNEAFFTKVEARVLDDAGQISDHLPLLFDFVLKE